MGCPELGLRLRASVPRGQQRLGRSVAGVGGLVGLAQRLPAGGNGGPGGRVRPALEPGQLRLGRGQVGLEPPDGRRGRVGERREDRPRPGEQLVRARPGLGDVGVAPSCAAELGEIRLRLEPDPHRERQFLVARLAEQTVGDLPTGVLRAILEELQLGTHDQEPGGPARVPELRAERSPLIEPAMGGGEVAAERREPAGCRAVEQPHDALWREHRRLVDVVTCLVPAANGDEHPGVVEHVLRTERAPDPLLASAREAGPSDLDRALDIAGLAGGAGEVVVRTAELPDVAEPLGDRHRLVEVTDRHDRLANVAERAREGDQRVRLGEWDVDCPGRGDRPFRRRDRTVETADVDIAGVAGQDDDLGT